MLLCFVFLWKSKVYLLGETVYYWKTYQLENCGQWWSSDAAMLFWLPLFSLFSPALIQSCYLSFTCWWPAKIHFPCLSLFVVKCESSGSFGYLKHRYCKHVAVGPLWSHSSSLGMALLSTPALAAQIQLQGVCTDHSLMMRILLWLMNVILLEIQISWLLKKKSSFKL